VITSQQADIIVSVTEPLNPKLLGVFGSYARGESSPSSDLDILIDFDQRINLLELIAIEQQLFDFLGIKIDLITLRSVNPALLKYIEADLIRLI
jgi:predicted nucleotidyltransferase